MLSEITRLASELIKFPSVATRPRGRAACISFIESFFKNAQIPFTIWEPADVRSLVVKLGSEEIPRLCLNAHYDVVEAPVSAYRPRRDGDRLYGRGAADMKTALAAMMILMTELAKRPDPPSVALMVVGDSELGGQRGTAHILKCGFRCYFALVGEPTHLALSNQSKGHLTLELSAGGVACHASRPWEGDNALFNFFRQFPAVWEIFGDAEPYAWQTTMVPSLLRAGDSPNRVPDHCTCLLDIHYVPLDRPEELIEKIEKAAPELKVKVIDQGEAFFTDPKNPFLQCLRATATEVLKHDPGLTRKHAASDAHHFTSYGIPTAVFGPGGENVHGTGEWVDLRQVAQFYRTLERLVDAIMAMKLAPSAGERQEEAARSSSLP